MSAVMPVEPPAAPRTAVPGLVRRLLARRAAAIALAALLLLGTGALFVPVFAPHAGDTLQLENRNRPPSPAHPFGTDDLGRDTLVRVLQGGRVSLGVAFVATCIAVALGTLLGAWAGWRGGLVDAAVQQIVDVALSVPTFFVLLLLGAWFGAHFATLCLVIGLTNWMPVTRLVRAATLSLRERPFVEAARALGFGAPRILWRHVLPLAVAPILIAAALAGAQAILVEAALGFLGFGLQPPTASWGTMLQEAQAHVFDAPWVAVFPGLCILGTVLALHFLADALRDALDVRLR